MFDFYCTHAAHDRLYIHRLLRAYVCMHKADHLILVLYVYTMTQVYILIHTHTYPREM